MASSISGFMNLRYQINAVTQLSTSGWEEGGFFTQAVALIVNGEVQHATAKEFRHKREDAAFSAASYYATDLVKAEYEKAGQEMPLRFFRDNGIETDLRKQARSKR